MFDQVAFAGPHDESYVLMRDTSFDKPWPTSARFEGLEPSSGAQVILESLCDAYGNPNWAVLDLLGIREHPSNIRPHELAVMVKGLVEDAHSRRFLVYRRIEEALVPLKPLPRPSEAAPAPAPRTSLDFLSVELVDVEGRALPGIVFELAFADGEHRRASTNHKGALLVNDIASGSCALTLDEPPPPRQPPR